MAESSDKLKKLMDDAVKRIALKRGVLLMNLEPDIAIHAGVSLAFVQQCRKGVIPTTPYATDNFLKLTKVLVDWEGLDQKETRAFLKAAGLGNLFDTLDFDDLPLPEDTPPYKGLQNYEFTDEAWFFGREKEIGEMVKRLRQTPLLMVVGGSGYGKSSLVRAGLAPAWLEKKGKPYILTPTSDPLAQLASVLTRDIESTTAQRTLMDDMRQDPRTLQLFLLKHHLPETQPDILLIVDQFEELFTLCTDVDTRQIFLDNLFLAAFPDATENSPLETPTDLRYRPRLVFILRSDFYTPCLDYPHLRQALGQFQFPVGPLSREGLRAIIEQPAQKGGWAFEPGLVDAILNDCATRDQGDPEPGALPLLSHALQETWQRRRGMELTFAGYHAAGGVKKAIATTANQVYDALSEPEQATARRIFLSLVEYNEGGPDTRRRAALRDVVTTAETQKVLDELAHRRLLTVEEEQVDVAHEALIRAWAPLQEWLAQNLDARRLHDHLHKAAAAWHRMGRRPDDLYRGLTLARALDWLKDPTPEPAQLERDFLEASQKAQMREMRAVRTRQILFALVTVLVGLSLAFAIWGRSFFLKPFFPRPKIAWVLIPEGEFWMGSDGNPGSDEYPRHRVDLEAYYMMLYEVTNQEYAACVFENECTPPSGYSTAVEFADGIMAKQKHPVVNVNWFQAQAFCEWEGVGGRLPTEAEWERGTGGTDGRIYPWGSEPFPTCDLANFSSCVGNTTTVGSYPAGRSPDGLYDMAGNVWEWVADWYDVYPGGNPEASPVFGTTYRVLRGGSWFSDGHNLRSADRDGLSPAYDDNSNVGFRCARSP